MISCYVSRHVALLQSPMTNATIWRVRRHSAVHNHRAPAFFSTKLHISSSSRTSSADAGRSVSSPSGSFWIGVLIQPATVCRGMSKMRSTPQACMVSEVVASLPSHAWKRLAAVEGEKGLISTKEAALGSSQPLPAPRSPAPVSSTLSLPFITTFVVQQRVANRYQEAASVLPEHRVGRHAVQMQRAQRFRTRDVLVAVL